MILLRKISMSDDIFIIGDTHFFHARILEFEPRRLQLGLTVEDMNWEIVKLWNSVVGKNDGVVHLGDVAFQLGSRMEEIIRLIGSLNGVKALIKGNHDHKADDVYIKMGFSKVMKGPVNFGKVLLSHQPELDTKILNVHGHLHTYPNPSRPSHRPEKSPDPDSKLHYNASIEMLPEFKPIRLSEILRIRGVE
jgi:calcineurin-like phosphoesterase family protein